MKAGEWVPWAGMERAGTVKGNKEHFGVKEMFCFLIVVVVTQIYTVVNSLIFTFLKCLHSFVCKV